MPTKSAIKLTHGQWLVVQRQCSLCPLWDNDTGCQYRYTKAGNGSHEYPVEDCRLTIWERIELAEELELI